MKILLRIPAFILLFTAFGLAQTNNGDARQEQPKIFEASVSSKITYLDENGLPISSREFRDAKAAETDGQNLFEKKLLEDGKIEYRLKKNSYEGKPAPVFSVRTIDGKTINSADLKGKVVVLNFWFIGCAGCLAEMPKLNEFVEKYKANEDVVFIALTFDAADAVKRFLQKKTFNYQMAADAREILKTFVFEGYPRNVVVGKNGEIVYWRSNIWAWEKFASVIEKELERAEKN